MQIARRSKHAYLLSMYVVVSDDPVKYHIDTNSTPMQYVILPLVAAAIKDDITFFDDVFSAAKIPPPDVYKCC